MAINKKQLKWGVNIQEEIQELMRTYNLSKEDLASRLGVCMMTIYRWEQGKALPKSRYMLRELEELKRELGKNHEATTSS